MMKNIESKLLLAILLLILTASLVGCKSKKRTIDGSVTKEWEFNNALNDVLQNELQYTTLSAKGGFELRAGGQSGKKVTAVYKIIKDSIMQISIRVPLLGEVVCINLTPDSAVIIDRLKGRYASEMYSKSDFMKSIDFNYYNLQSLLTNKLFVPGKQMIQPADYSRFKLSKVTDVLMLQTSGEPDIAYNFAVDGTEKIVSVLIAKKDLDSTLQFTYSDFIKDSEQVYPTVIEGALSTEKYKLGFAVTYPSLEIDKKNMRVDTNIPRKYTKVSIQELLEPYFNTK